MCAGAGEPEEDELYESGVLDSNGVYGLQEGKLVPHKEAWASIPSVTLLNSKEVYLCVKVCVRLYVCVCVSDFPDSLSL